MPWTLWTVVFLALLMSSWYECLRTASRTLGSAMVRRRRKTRKADSLVISLFAESAHTDATALMTSRTTFLKDRIYGSKADNDSKVILNVGASDKFSSRWCIETVCDLRSGVSVRNFFESVGTRLSKSVHAKQLRTTILHLACRRFLHRQMVLQDLRHKLQCGYEDLVIDLVMSA